jgi:hypothetical protein
MSQGHKHTYHKRKSPNDQKNKNNINFGGNQSKIKHSAQEKVNPNVFSGRQKKNDTTLLLSSEKSGQTSVEEISMSNPLKAFLLIQNSSAKQP